MTVETLIAEIVERVSRVEGVRAIVLGGSRARGTHTPDSDVDLGIFYSGDQPFDVATLNRIASELDDQHRSELVSELNAWGPWLNGGGWVSVGGREVDFIYRDIARIQRYIAACHSGLLEMVYQPGRPHGVSSALYMGEVALSRALWDPCGAFATLQAQAASYPPALKRAVVEKFAWEAGLSAKLGRNGISRADLSYVAGCCFRSVACLLQTIFALNEQHWINEKGAVDLAETFSLKPARLRERIENVFERLAPDALALESALGLLEELVHDTEELGTAL